MVAPVKMLVTYPLYFALEKAVVSSQTFEKTWGNLRPRLERGVELVADEVHPQGYNLIRKYVYQEPAVRRVINECLKEMLATDVMALVTQIRHLRGEIEKRKIKILEMEKDLLVAPKRSSWNPLDFSQSKLKDRIHKARTQNESQLVKIDELCNEFIVKMARKGVAYDKAQVLGLIDTAEGEDVATLISVAEIIKQVFNRMELQLKDSPSVELSKTYCGFYMMCNKLYLEAIERALRQVGKVYVSRVSGIYNEARRQINRAEAQLSTPNLSEANKQTLRNNISVNKQILEICDFYTKHLNNRTKEILELQQVAKVNYEVSLNTFITMKLGAELADSIKSAEQDMAKIFDFKPPTLSAMYDLGFEEQFRAVTRQIKKQ